MELYGIFFGFHVNGIWNSPKCFEVWLFTTAFVDFTVKIFMNWFRNWRITWCKWKIKKGLIVLGELHEKGNVIVLTLFTKANNRIFFRTNSTLAMWNVKKKRSADDPNSSTKAIEKNNLQGGVLSCFSKHRIFVISCLLLNIQQVWHCSTVQSKTKRDSIA